EGARQLVIEVGGRGNYSGDIAVGHPEACVRKDLVQRADEHDVRWILELPAPRRAAPLEQLQDPLYVTIRGDEIGLGVEPFGIARNLHQRLEEMCFEVQRLQPLTLGGRRR